MKFFVVAVCLIGLVSAEAPRFRSQRLNNRFFARQEVELTTPPAEEAPYPPASSPPYPASGWKPDGPAFDLPAARAEPDDAYGTPVAATYGPPDNEYGAPTTPPAATDELADPQSEAVDITSNDQTGRYRQSQRLRLADQGSFFVIQPGSTLQRIRAPARLVQGARNGRFNRF